MYTHAYANMGYIHYYVVVHRYVFLEFALIIAAICTCGSFQLRACGGTIEAPL